MKYRREFEIAYIGLKEGITHFNYEIDDYFFKQLEFEHPEFEHIKAEVKLYFDKKVNFFMLHFDIGGIAEVLCDRCGSPFELKLWDEYDLIVKLTNESNHKAGSEDEDDVVFLSRNETVLDVSEWIYEFIRLSLPIQKIHPDNEDGTSGCDPEVLKILNEMEEREEDNKKNNIWKGLDNLKSKTSKKSKD